MPKIKCVFTDSSNEQYPCVKDNGRGSGSGHLRGGMFIVPCSVQLKLGEGGEIRIDQVSTK